MQAIIKVDNISFNYYENPIPALQSVSFEVNAGEWVAIIGPNGSGKSTLAKTLNGLLVVDQGTIRVNDLLVNDENLWEIRSKVGMVFQNPDNQFVGATVEDDVAFGLENNGIPRPEMIERVQSALDQVKMLEFKKREPARLSGGQKQRVALASVLALRPDIIILDEATAMLDPNGRAEVIQAIKAIKAQHQLTVISITHDIDEASLADRVLMMHQGQLVYNGTPGQLFTKEPELIQLGLELPFSQRLKLSLTEKGVTVEPEFQTEEAFKSWLMTSYLRK